MLWCLFIFQYPLQKNYIKKAPNWIGRLYLLLRFAFSRHIPVYRIHDVPSRGRFHFSAKVLLVGQDFWLVMHIYCFHVQYKDAFIAHKFQKKLYNSKLMVELPSKRAFLGWFATLLAGTLLASPPHWNKTQRKAVVYILVWCSLEIRFLLFGNITLAFFPLWNRKQHRYARLIASIFLT